MPPGASPGSAISLCRIGKRSGRPIRYRLKKKVKRRTDVVGVFPNPAALLRLAGSLLVEAHDEWQVAEKRYLSEYHIQDALWLIGRKRSAGVFGPPWCWLHPRHPHHPRSRGPSNGYGRGSWRDGTHELVRIRVMWESVQWV